MLNIIWYWKNKKLCSLWDSLIDVEEIDILNILNGWLVRVDSILIILFFSD